MAENTIELKSVGDLHEMNFFIPSYQRGYRWTEQQVKDLLDDIDEFINEQKSDGFYCLQPLVVKAIPNAENKWEVIDGQQRLTTIFILLSYLYKEALNKNGENAKKYSLEYETRKSSKYFLEHIKDCSCTIDSNSKKLKNCKNECLLYKDNKVEYKCPGSTKVNIDYYNMLIAKATVENWFNAKGDDVKKYYKEILLNSVKFIWYESVDEDPIAVFTRLNIGKISLTNAELIKALFLNRSNFAEKEYQHIHLKQQEIASEWDKIEYTLQNDEFWLFLNQVGYDKPTRIDMIFDLICEQDGLGVGNGNISTDQYKTFRYFYNFFKLKKKDSLEEFIKTGKTKIEFCWSKVKKIFQTFEEWYNDLELYHYVGYLIAINKKTKINELLKLWKSKKVKSSFIGLSLKQIIKVELGKQENSAIEVGLKKKLEECNCIKDIETRIEEEYSKDEKVKTLLGKIKEEFKKESLREKIIGTLDECNDLNKEYETSGNPKTQCKPLLLLHNIQTVINQNKNYASKDSYKLQAFYKFPFHLYKLEKWDVEHIDSNSTKELTDIKEQKEWLKDMLLDISDDKSYKDILQRIKAFIQQDKTDDFNNIREELEKPEKAFTAPDRLQEDNGNGKEKNLVWNYCLLDSSTNRSYGNAIFSAKRRTIIGKDQGKNFSINDDLKISKEDGAIAFIPPCTKNVFLKYYNPATNILRAWSKADAEAYLLNINEVLSNAGFIDDQKDKIEQMYNEAKSNKENTHE